MATVKKCSINLCLPVLCLIFFISIVQAKNNNPLSKIDILEAVNRGEASLSATEWDLGDVLNCFDDDTTTIMRSANINPAFVQVTFTDQVSVSKIRVLLGQPGFPQIDKNDWWVEIADNEDDLLSKTGSYQLIVPTRHDVAGSWDEATLASPANAKIWRFNVERTVGDDYVHIPELELWTITSPNKFLIIVSSPLMQTGLLTDALNTYQQDLLNEGWNSTVITVNKNNSPPADFYCPEESDLKNVIRNFYNQGCEGFVIIGSNCDIPTAYWRFHEYDIDYWDNNPTDLYYADVDEWVDIGNDGTYESYYSDENHNPDYYRPANPDNPILLPELFYGRISFGTNSSSPEDEALEVREYLDKVHNYRVNGTNLTTEQANRALGIVDDGEGSDKITTDFARYLVPNIYEIADYGFGNATRYAEELEKGYKYSK